MSQKLIERGKKSDGKTSFADAGLFWSSDSEIVKEVVVLEISLFHSSYIYKIPLKFYYAQFSISGE